ncbi:hypothetical protein ABPG72_009604 [Tetrahymena utriculariae]
MIRISNFLKNIDFNSQPFYFFVEKDEKKKKTEVGGFFGFIVIIISTIYLVYLLHLFFGNQLLPKITTQIQNQTSKINQAFNKSIFGITYTTQGLNPQQLEQQTGKVFLTYQLQKQTFQQGNYDTMDLNFVDCQDDPNFIGYLCIDLSNLPETVKEVFTDPTHMNQSFYSLTIQPCQGLTNCASQQEIDKYILQNSFVFFIKIRVNQFNQQSQKMNETFLVDYFQFDQNISIYQQYFLQQQISTLTQGFLIEGQQTTIDITSYRKSTSYYSQQNLLQKAGFTGFGQFQFSLDQQQIITRIQFPLLTETLAQFFPIFNILLTFGIIAKKFAETKIIQDMSNIHLKDYYKQTAIKLISNFNKDLFVNKSQLTQAEYIQQLQSTINKIYIQERKQETQGKGFQRKAKQGTNQLESEVKKILLDQTKKKLNIYEVYSDLIEVKTAIRLLMSSEQYAAMKFCGCNISLDSADTQKYQKNEQLNVRNSNKVQPSFFTPLNSKNLIQEDVINSPRTNNFENKECREIECKQKEEVIILNTNFEKISKKNNEEKYFDVNKLAKNHLEEIEEMLNSEQMLLQKLQNFLEKIQNKNTQLTQTDINIYSSLIGHNNYQDFSLNELVLKNQNS